MTQNSKSRCQGLTKSGQPCRAAATAGGLCFFHANPKKAAELGRLGGMRNRHVVVGGADPDPQLALDKALAILDGLARLMTDFNTGKIHPNYFPMMPPVFNLQLRAVETIAKLEDRVRATSASHPVSNRQRPETGKRTEESARSQVLEQAIAL